jgi:hypothetical protein
LAGCGDKNSEVKLRNGLLSLIVNSTAAQVAIVDM